MKIKKKDLINLCRHIYLCGYNDGLNNKETNPQEEFNEEWESERDECIQDFIKDVKDNGYMCYGDYCGSKKHPQHKAEAIGKQAIVDRGFVEEGACI